MSGVDRRWRSAPSEDDRRHLSRRRASQEQEAMLPQLQPGGRAQPGSGCSRRAGRKSDSRGDLFLVSGKSTATPGAKSSRVERAWLEEVEQQAEVLHPPLRPAITLGFDREDGQPRLDYTAFRQRDAERMVAVVAAVLDGDFDEARRQAEMLA